MPLRGRCSSITKEAFVETVDPSPCSWTSVPLKVWSVAVSRDGAMFASTDKDLLLSSDNGATWVDTSANCAVVWNEVPMSSDAAKTLA